MTVRVIPILAVAIVIGPSLTYGSPACMTESEIRAKYPHAHLIWHGTGLCWKFGGEPVHSRRAAVAAGPVPSIQAVLDEKERVPYSRPEIVNSGIDVTGAQCRYSDAIPCEQSKSQLCVCDWDANSTVILDGPGLREAATRAR